MNLSPPEIPACKMTKTTENCGYEIKKKRMMPSASTTTSSEQMIRGFKKIKTTSTNGGLPI